MISPDTDRLCRRIDPPALFLSVSAPLLVLHVNHSKGALASAASESNNAATDEDLLTMYHGMRELKDMFAAFCPEYAYSARWETFESFRAGADSVDHVLQRSPVCRLCCLVRAIRAKMAGHDGYADERVG